MHRSTTKVHSLAVLFNIKWFSKCKTFQRWVLLLETIFKKSLELLFYCIRFLCIGMNYEALHMLKKALCHGLRNNFRNIYENIMTFLAITIFSFY